MERRFAVNQFQTPHSDTFLSTCLCGSLRLKARLSLLQELRVKLAAAEKLAGVAAQHESAWQAALSRGRQTEESAAALHAQVGYLQVRRC